MMQRLPIYRMTHNVPFILRNGLWSKLSAEREAAGTATIAATTAATTAATAAASPSATAQGTPKQDPAFKAIGNADIIGRRTNKRVVVIPPGGVLGEIDTNNDLYYQQYD